MNKNVKVKVFRFEVLNGVSQCFLGDRNSSLFGVNENELDDEAFIENVINNFLQGKELVDIKINTADGNHQNGTIGNTIHLIYTIIYAE